jgi:hypothetical protein
MSPRSAAESKSSLGPAMAAAAKPIVKTIMPASDVRKTEYIELLDFPGRKLSR